MSSERSRYRVTIGLLGICVFSVIGIMILSPKKWGQPIALRVTNPTYFHANAPSAYIFFSDEKKAPSSLKFSVKSSDGKTIPATTPEGSTYIYNLNGKEFVGMAIFEVHKSGDYLACVAGDLGSANCCIAEIPYAVSKSFIPILICWAGLLISLFAAIITALSTHAQKRPKTSVLNPPPPLPQ